MLMLAAGTLGAVLLFPVRSLFRGPVPAEALRSTPWEDGSVVVRDDGRAVRPDDVGPDEVLTVFPSGHTDASDAAVLLIRVDPDRLTLDPQRREWTVDGLVAYSKLCTHAGCPVGQYVPTTGELMCPCHQSLFDALGGAVPIAGPAARPLPQLPLALRDGTLVARGDFSDPVGPGYWRRV
jgi:ubiquinol-cytochrome c reductase iron-sulfur subunit